MITPSQADSKLVSEGNDPAYHHERKIDPLLSALGYPTSDAAHPGLTALHAGAAFHRLALLHDVVEMYANEAQLPSAEPVYLDLLRRPMRGEPPRSTAKWFYRAALRVDERLAEAWFNLGRLLQDANDQHGALVAFNRAAELAPHPDALPHAHLHANAHWHAATILEDMGRDAEALVRYREAVARCDNFGVHHVRFAHFLRRCGLVAEAIENYQRLMTYSHRYFTEFVLPPLKPPPVVAPPVVALEVLYETSDGAPVVFWNNVYFCLPKSALPATTEKLAALSAAASSSGENAGIAGRFRMLFSLLAFWRYETPLRQASSISELESARRWRF